MQHGAKSRDDETLYPSMGRESLKLYMKISIELPWDHVRAFVLEIVDRDYGRHLSNFCLPP